MFVEVTLTRYTEVVAGATVRSNVEVDPQFGMHRMVKAIKGRTSRLLRQELPTLRSRLPTLWTNSYFVATVGGAPLSVVKRYVESQKSL